MTADSTPTVRPDSAGWQADPWRVGELRWWDGSSWTEHTHGADGNGRPASGSSGRPGLWRSQWALIVLTLAGLAVASAGFIQIAAGTLGTLTASPHQAPGTIAQECDPGTYMVYEQSGTTTSAGPVTYTDQEPTRIAPADVSVRGPQGPVAVGAPTATYTVTQGSTIYVGVAQFEVRRPGRYTVEVSGGPARYLLERRLFDGTGGAIVLVLCGGVIGCVSVVAFVAIVLVKSRRRRT